MSAIANQHSALLRSGLTSAIRYLKWLDDHGQVDLDDNGEPVVSGFDKEPEGVRVHFVRNELFNNTFIPKRAQWPADSEPKFWTTLDTTDGWTRAARELKSAAVSEPEPATKERARRVAEDWIKFARRLAGV